MSILALGAGDKIKLTTIKSLTTNPDAKWVNTYEFLLGIDFGGGAPTAANFAQLATEVVEWERGLTFTTTLYERAIVSTWIQDTVPYNGNEFVSVPMSVSGTRVPTSEVVSLNQCLLVQRVAQTGRAGRILLRNALQEGDIQASAGAANLTGTYLTALNNGLAPGGANDLIGNLETTFGLNGVELSMFGVNTAAQETVRRVNSLVASDRIVFKKLNNRYFRRTP